MNTVPQGGLIGLGLAALISLLAPFVVYFVCRKRMELPLRNIALGAGIFALFALGLEGAMHYYFLKANPTTSAWLLHNTWGYVVYGVSAAALFEETGRLIAFRFFAKRTGDAGTGVSYGIGHGGAESIIIGALGQAQAIVFALLLDAGKLQGTLGAKLPPATYAKIRDSLLHLNFLIGIAGGFERIAALLLQIALSLLVWRAVERREWRWFLAALLLHAGVDTFAALGQRGALSVVTVEIVVYAVGLVLLVFFLAKLPRRPASN
ncbi:MAG TPA: YhfC family glutamic-type intramembrane protease [Rhizomicrobium sp.]|jgi:uncharacterized membrane protein YhfC|nr:YhfC family glutamic-type intramembrane protease [Rhizomicrobium sp.]